MASNTIRSNPVVYRSRAASGILLILAVLCFLLATFHAPVPVVDLTDLGLAFGFGAFLFVGLP